MGNYGSKGESCSRDIWSHGTQARSRVMLCLLDDKITSVKGIHSSQIMTI